MDFLDWLRQNSGGLLGYPGASNPSGPSVYPTSTPPQLFAAGASTNNPPSSGGDHIYGAPMAVSQSGNLPWNQGSNQPSAPQMPTFEDFLKSMGIDLSDNTSSVSPGAAVGAVHDQYNPVINHLKKSIGRTKREGEKTDNQLQKVFAAVARADQRTAQRINKSGKRVSNKIDHNYDQLARVAGNTTDKASDSITARLKDLGLSASDEAATRQVDQQGAMNQNIIGRQGAQEESANRSNTENWRNFARGAAINTRTEGANRRADLAGQISDLVFGIRGQIADTKSQEAAAAAAAQQAAEQANASSNSSADSLRAQLYGQFLSLMKPTGSSSSSSYSAPSLEGFDAAKQGIAQYLHGVDKTNPNYDANIPQDIGTIMNMLMQNAPAIQSQNTNGYGQPTPLAPEDFMKQLMALAQQKGYRPESIQAIANIAPDLFQYLQNGSSPSQYHVTPPSYYGAQ